MADIWGTNYNDYLRCGSGNAALGLGGDDILTSVPRTGVLDQILVGGIGNDTYYATEGASTVILDVSGAYDVLHTAIYMNNPSYLYTVGGKHLMMGDYITGCYIAIPDVKNCGLEAITFASGEVFTFKDFYAFASLTMMDVPWYTDQLSRYIYDFGNTLTKAKYYPQNMGQEIPVQPVQPPTKPLPPPSPVDQATTAYFNESQYLNNKLDALHKEGQKITLEGLIDAIANAGMTPLQHFKKFGAFEMAADGKIGIDPSTKFDISTYYENKVVQCNNKGEKFDLAGILKVFQDSGLDPITHYALYGQGEGLTPVPVVGTLALEVSDFI